MFPKKSLRDDRTTTSTNQGQSLIEFAILLPILFLILLGAVDLGRLYYAQVTITNASREAARYGTDKPKDTTGVKARANAEANGALNPANISVECAPYDLSSSYSSGYCTSAVNGDRIRVTINYSFNFLTLYIFNVANLNLSSFTTMAITSAS